MTGTFPEVPSKRPLSTHWVKLRQEQEPELPRSNVRVSLKKLQRVQVHGAEKDQGIEACWTRRRGWAAPASPASWLTCPLKVISDRSLGDKLTQTPKPYCLGNSLPSGPTSLTPGAGPEPLSGQVRVCTANGPQPHPCQSTIPRCQCWSSSTILRAWQPFAWPPSPPTSSLLPYQSWETQGSGTPLWENS